MSCSAMQLMNHDTAYVLSTHIPVLFAFCTLVCLFGLVSFRALSSPPLQMGQKIALPVSKYHYSHVTLHTIHITLTQVV